MTAGLLDPIEDAIAAIGRGEIVVVVDDEGRENEGDLIMAADAATPERLAFFVRHTSGVICVGLTAERCAELDLPPMVPPNANTELHGTAFTVSVDARDGTTTGISAADRARTLRGLADPALGARAFNRPGHVFPLCAVRRGVLQRAGHTEAAVDLCRLAGRQPAGVLCEIVLDSGEMARLPDLRGFADEHGLLLVSIADLIAHRRARADLDADDHTDADDHVDAGTTGPDPTPSGDTMTTIDGHLDGSGLRIALVCSRFNDLIVGRLEQGARDALLRHGTAGADITTVWVPGAWELPIAAKALAASGRYDAVVALGAVMRGATYHFEIVANHSAAGIARVALDTDVVVTNGILTVDTMDQALERAGSKAGNKGADAALAAIETVQVLRQIR